jgi:very-short-patch-repair endonuclease
MSQGFRVFRFSNAAVMQNMNFVLDSIHAALVRATPTPNPSPQGGGELEM